MPNSASISGLPWPAVLISLVCGALIAAAAVLWTYFGTAVFFEMIRTGLAACF